MIHYHDDYHERPDEPTEKSEVASLLAEVCQRPNEWAEIESKHRVNVWLLKVAQMLQAAGTESAWAYLQAQAGDLNAIAEDWTTRGERRGMSKQGAHKGYVEAVDRLHKLAPEVGRALDSIDAIHKQHEGRGGVGPRYTP